MFFFLLPPESHTRLPSPVYDVLAGTARLYMNLHAMQFVIGFSPYKRVSPPVSAQGLALFAETISFCWF